MILTCAPPFVNKQSKGMNPFLPKIHSSIPAMGFNQADQKQHNRFGRKSKLGLSGPMTHRPFGARGTQKRKTMSLRGPKGRGDRRECLWCNLQLSSTTKCSPINIENFVIAIQSADWRGNLLLI